jgi:arabinoxylan arabinofuranohydrolase
MIPIKNIRWVLGFLLVLSPIFFTGNAENPIITQKYCADPNAMVFKGRVYVFCSSDEDNSGSYTILKYTLISSDDMANWTDHGEVFKAKSVTTWASQAYAPTACYRNGKVYLYFPNGGDNIGVAVADKPEGPYTDPLGKALITKSMPNCNVSWCFDPCVFVDSTATGVQAYLTFGGGENTSSPYGSNLRIIKLNDDMISVSGTAVTVTAQNSFEASFLHKNKNKYYFSYATTGASKMDYLMSDSPMSGFTYVGTVLDNPTLNGKNIDNNNNNHAHPVFYIDKWYMFYHDRRISGEVYKRDVSVDVLNYNADGTMKKVVVTSEGPTQIKSLNPFDTVQAETIGKQNGIKTDVCSEGGMMVTSIAEGDWIRYTGVDFGGGANKFEARVAAATGGSIELHLESEAGTKIGACEVASTGGFSTWKTVSCNVTGASGVKNLFLVFKGSGEPLRFNWFKFASSTSVGGTIGLSNEKQSISPSKKRPCALANISGNVRKVVNISGRAMTTVLHPSSHHVHGSGVLLQQPKKQ